MKKGNKAMQTRESILARIALLEARDRDNQNIVKKLKRKLRAMENAAK